MSGSFEPKQLSSISESELSGSSTSKSSSGGPCDWAIGIVDQITFTTDGLPQDFEGFTGQLPGGYIYSSMTWMIGECRFYWYFEFWWGCGEDGQLHYYIFAQYIQSEVCISCPDEVCCDSYWYESDGVARDVNLGPNGDWLVGTFTVDLPYLMGNCPEVRDIAIHFTFSH
jgi:hypothetical protein